MIRWDIFYFIASSKFPYANRTVKPTGSNLLAVRTRRQSHHPLGASFQPAYELSSLDIPHNNRLVIPCRDEEFAIRAECQGADPISMLVHDRWLPGSSGRRAFDHPGWFLRW